MQTLDALPDDLRDLLVALVDAGVDFVVVGGWAMAAHGRPRATQDLDVFVRPSEENAHRLVAALAAFGAPVAAHAVTPQLFRTAGYGYRFGVKPNLVELFNVISGVDFETASSGATAIDLDGRAIPIIGRGALLTHKRAAGRHEDLDDVEWLEAHPPRRA